MVSTYESFIGDPAAPELEVLLESALAPPLNQQVQVVGFEPSTASQRRGTSARRTRGGRTRIETKKIGDHGELLILAEEKRRLIADGRSDLAELVDHPAVQNKYPGYDIKSFNRDGSERLIEVKSSRGDSRVWHVTPNEWDAAARYGDRYWLYFVTKVFKRSVHVVSMRNPVLRAERGEIQVQPDGYELRV